mmetsp:Transcript_53906/g.65077  ORF Transcript_53906/g.65077 Transcript_53906/m.65077 type:complete len:310 (+) Transcript_53906:216-1145(+)
MIRALHHQIQFQGHLLVFVLVLCRLLVNLMHSPKVQSMFQDSLYMLKTADEPSNKTVFDSSYTTKWLLQQKNARSVFELSVNEWPRGDEPLACDSGSRQPWFYVNEELPHEFTTDIERKIEQMVENEQIPVQENVGTEWAVLQLFRTSPCRSFNMSQASMVVVPYLHYSHCFFSPGYWMNCLHIPNGKMENLMKSLNYKGGNSSTPHLFLAVYDDIMVHPKITQNPLRLTSGPLLDSNIPIILPIFNDHPRYQPSQILQRSDLWWTMRPRKYSFAAIYGFNLNPRMGKRQSRRFRGYFLKMLHSMPGFF